MEQEPRPYPRLVLFGLVVASFAAAIPAGLWPPGAWYQSLVTPAWNPPAWVFGPVWCTLYLMMGVAAWRVWRATHARREQALRLWWIQLFLNALWSPLFFGLHRLDLALLEILALLGFIAATAHVCWRIDRGAGLLLIPYLAWVGFASFLTFTLWQLNR